MPCRGALSATGHPPAAPARHHAVGGEESPVRAGLSLAVSGQASVEGESEMGTGHSHVPTATGRHRGRLSAVLAITIGIAVAEVCGALVSGALVLLADARAGEPADVTGCARHSLLQCVSPFVKRSTEQSRRHLRRRRSV